MIESNVMRHVWLAVAATSVMFRINSGRGWISNRGPKGVRKLENGSVLITEARPIALGLSKPNGAPVEGVHDLIGWTSMLITPEMVGMRVAVLTEIECKHSDGGHRTPEQIAHGEIVRAAGGIAGFANSPDVAKRIIFEYGARLTQK